MNRWAADRSRDRKEELAYYEQEAARDTRFTQRVVSVNTSRRGAEAVTRWTKEGRTGGYVLEPGTPTQEAGGMTSEFRGSSRFRLVRDKDELVIRSVCTTYDLRLPVCAPPSKCANTPGAGFGPGLRRDRVARSKGRRHPPGDLPPSQAEDAHPLHPAEQHGTAEDGLRQRDQRAKALPDTRGGVHAHLGIQVVSPVAS